VISRYRILAQVDLLHDYYADGKTLDFDIIPSAGTAEIMTSHRLSAKVTGNSLLVLTPVDETGKPAVALPADLRLVFHLELRNPSFLTVSNVDADALRSLRFHFTNLAGNAVGSPPNRVLNLTRPAPAYDNGRAYVPGEMAAIGSTVYECIRAATGQTPDAPDSAFWVSRGQVQAAAVGDLVPIRPRLAGFTLQTGANAFRIRIQGLDTASGDYTRLIREDTLPASSVEPVKNVQADLTALPPGRYRLDINGEIFEAWFDDEALARGSLAVVEIFNHLPPADAYALLDGTGLVRETAYAIRFANRRAFWKYVAPLRKVDSILPSSDHALPSPFTPGSNDPAQPALKDFFLSNRPLPLAEAPGENLFDLMIGSEARPAPKPDPRLPGLLTHVFDAPTQRYLDSVCTIRLNN
jgi:hypothetical protein